MASAACGASMPAMGGAKIIDAIKAQAERMDYATAFQMGHPGAFELASKLSNMLPGDLNHVFFANSGSEAVDTALKIALAYHRANGEASRTRFIGRERGYHGVGFGGTAVGGISANRKQFGNMLGGVDHLPHTHNLAEMAFSKGQPDWGAHLADDLERIVALHDASTIAAVIVEPIAGSTGVLVPPKGYLDRLRSICTKHGLLLILDEVITGFGRTGAAFGAERFGIQPDIMTLAKGLTNAAVPMSAVAASDAVHDGLMVGPENTVELFHGYTYSGPSAGLRRGAGDAGYLCPRRAVRACRQHGAHMGGCAAFAKRCAACGRYPQYRPRRRGSKSRPATARRAPARTICFSIVSRTDY